LQALNQLNQRIEWQDKWFDKCKKDMEAKYSTWAHIPSVFPAEGAITSKFGALRSLFGGPKAIRHQGVDIAGPIGLSVKATADGTVFFAGWMSGYGNLVIIDHENGFYSYYGHCSLLHVVEGQKVKRYQTIALLGNTGRSTGPHIHYEIREENSPRDPEHFVEENLE
jgi:murein DD-endopeptidase MepM/ murein hydrolase activator NlpD